LTYHYSENGETVSNNTLRYPANNEVRQINKITHADSNTVLAQKPEGVDYLYAPAGFFMNVGIPIKQIIETTATDPQKIVALNTAKLKIEVEKTAAMPAYLLLIKKDSIQSFFEWNKLPNKETSFISATLSGDSTSYTFDLTTYIQKRINSNDLSQEIAEMVVLPIKTTFSSSGTLTAVDNLMQLSGLTLKRKKFTIVYNEFYSGDY
jgi:hypothetical protein